MRHRLEYLAVASIALMVRAAAAVGWCAGWAKALGLMFYLVDRVHRRIALANLQVAFPKKSHG